MAEYQVIVTAMVNSNSPGDQAAELSRQKVRRNKVRTLLLATGMMLFLLGVMSLLASTLSESEICTEDCRYTFHIGIWSGTLFAFISSLLTLCLFFTSDQTNSSCSYSPLLLVNSLVACLALVAHFAMLIILSRVTYLATVDIRENAKQFSYAMPGDALIDASANPHLPTSLLLDPLNCYEDLSRVANYSLQNWKREIKQTKFFVGSTLGVCLATLLVLCDVVHLLTPLVLDYADRAAQDESVGVAFRNNTQAENQVYAEPDVPGTAVNRISQNRSRQPSRVITIEEVSERLRVVEPEPEPREIAVEACLYDLAKKTPMLQALQVAFGVKYKLPVYDSHKPFDLVTVTCESMANVPLVNGVENEEAKRKARALDTLKRFLERYVKETAKELRVSFPRSLVERMPNAQSRIVQALETELHGHCNYVPLAFDHLAAELGLLCTAESDAAVRLLQYTARRTLRNLVFDIDELFETRHNVSVFLLADAMHECRVLIYEGDLCQVPADFIVCPTADTLRYDRVSGLSKSIYSVAGEELRDELQRADARRDSKRLVVGEIVCTEGYRLPVSHILHVCGPDGASKEFSNIDDFKLALQRLYSDVFAAACLASPQEANDLKLVLPILSSGNFRGGHRLDACFDPLLRAIANATAGSLRRFSELHVVDVKADKITQLLRRVAGEFKTQFTCETDTRRVKLVRPDCQPFAYASATCGASHQTVGSSIGLAIRQDNKSESVSLGEAACEGKFDELDAAVANQPPADDLK